MTVVAWQTTVRRAVLSVGAASYYTIRKKRREDSPSYELKETSLFSSESRKKQVSVYT
jgi:hypothetical protein